MQMPKARALLRNHPERRPEDARLKFVAEAQLLRDHKRFDLAYELYAKAVAMNPDDPDLVYEQAMVAEKALRFDDMERLLRGLIARLPDYHHAYNALGYALADRNERLEEARDLISNAAGMVSFPVMGAAMRSGEVSKGHMRVLAEVTLSPSRAQTGIGVTVMVPNRPSNARKSATIRSNTA